MADTRLFSGKTAFVTGSSRGIGRVIATHFATLGASVAIQGTTPTSARAFGEADSLEAVARAIEAESGSRAFPVSGNLTDPETVRDLVRTIRATLGRIDILVNCAGETSAQPERPRPWPASPAGTMPSSSRSRTSARSSTATS